MNELPLWLDLLLAAMIVASMFFALVGAIGLCKLRDFMMRLHGPTKASTLGVGGALLASMGYFAWAGGPPVAHELMVTLFVFLTAPIAAHAMAKAAMRLDPSAKPPPRPDSEG